jgi:magnesium-transporting ATPase (P-type)
MAKWVALWCAEFRERWKITCLTRFVMTSFLLYDIHDWKSLPSLKTMKLPKFHTKPTPRIMLFYFAVAMLLITSGISSSGFILNNSILLLLGFVFWIIWFVLIFTVLLPQTEQFLNQRLRQLKKGALIIFISLFLLGLGEGISVAVLFPRVIQDKYTSTTTARPYRNRQPKICLKERTLTRTPTLCKRC